MMTTRRAMLRVAGFLAMLGGSKVGATSIGSVMPQGPPLPRITRVAYYRVPGGWVTAIMRQWRRGDSGPEGRCRLCPRCCAREDGCLIMVGALIRRKDAPRYDNSSNVPQSHNRPWPSFRA